MFSHTVLGAWWRTQPACNPSAPSGPVYASQQPWVPLLGPFSFLLLSDPQGLIQSSFPHTSTSSQADALSSRPVGPKLPWTSQQRCLTTVRSYKTNSSPTKQDPQSLPHQRFSLQAINLSTIFNSSLSVPPLNPSLPAYTQS